MHKVLKAVGIFSIISTLAACSSATGFHEYPAGSGKTAMRPYIGIEPFEIESPRYLFLTQLFQGKQTGTDTVIVYQHYPDNYTPGQKYPAMVLMHGSGGIDTRLRNKRDELAEQGYMVFMPMSFSGRNFNNAKELAFGAKAGVTKVTSDQSAITDTMVMVDAYMILNRLAKDPRIDANRVGIMGWSKGGTVAMYTGLEQIRGLLADGDNRFAYHIAAYPYCGYFPISRETTGSPIDIHIGSLDDYTPPEYCRKWMDELPRGQTNTTYHEYPYSAHMFDHPKIINMGATYWDNHGIWRPGKCTFTEREPGKFWEDHTNTGTFTREDGLKIYFDPDVCEPNSKTRIVKPPYSDWSRFESRVEKRTEEFAGLPAAAK